MGNTTMVEPSNYREVKSDSECWDILVNGGAQGYIMSCQGHDPTLSSVVLSTYEDSYFEKGSIRFNLTMGAIAQACNLSMEGRMFDRKEKVQPSEVKAFFTEEKLTRKRTNID